MAPDRPALLAALAALLQADDLGALAALAQAGTVETLGALVELAATTDNILDKWILSELETLIAFVRSEMEAYRLYTVVPRLVSFIDDLTNWYVRRSRARFWKSDDDVDKTNAFATLYTVLTTFSEVLAPFMPFLTEGVYQRLVRPVDSEAAESVHWRDYPQADTAYIQPELERRMAIVRGVSTLGRRVREDHKLKVRQPLRELTVVHRDATVREDVLAAAELIADELNVKRPRGNQRPSIVGF